MGKARKRYSARLPVDVTAVERDGSGETSVRIPVETGDSARRRKKSVDHLYVRVQGVQRGLRWISVGGT